MQDIGINMRRPQERVKAIVWADDERGIAEVIDYHYASRGWSQLVRHDRQQENAAVTWPEGPVFGLDQASLPTARCSPRLSL